MSLWSFNSNSSFDDEFTPANLQQYVYGIKIVEGDTLLFWGKADRVVKSLYNTNYVISSIGWYSELFKMVDKLTLPVISTYTLSGFITKVITDNFSPIITEANINVGTIDQNLDNYEYNFLRGDGCTIGTLLKEIQKYYAAYIFIDDKLHIINRHQSIVVDSYTDLSDDILDGEYDEYYDTLDYDGVLILIQNSPDTYSWNFWWVDASGDIQDYELKLQGE